MIGVSFEELEARVLANPKKGTPLPDDVFSLIVNRYGVERDIAKECTLLFFYSDRGEETQESLFEFCDSVFGPPASV